MGRVAWKIEILAGMESEYDRAHAEIWPSIEQNLRDAGARNFSIFRLDTTVFGYYECDDCEATKQAIADGETALGWGEALKHVVDPEVMEQGEDYLPEVYRLDD